MPAAVPGPQERWRCSLCGNLTRFDVVRTQTASEFVHLDLAGEPRVEERVVQEEVVSSVTCRWCGSTDVGVVPRPAAGGPVPDRTPPG